jgi:alpha-beta hydrolase superfamily lysophospholipase
VVVVLLALFTAAAWYFSGRIASAALDPHPAPVVPAYNDVQVVAVGPSSVTLKPGPDVNMDNFAAPAHYSLAWDGGWTRVGPATKNSDGTITRALEPVGAVDKPPAAGQLAAQDRAAWIGDATQSYLNGVAENVMVGDYPAWWFPTESKNVSTIAIFVHGQNGTRSNGTRFVPVAWAAGIPVLDITYRNDADVPADPSGLLQYGQTEWRDLDAAVTWARDKGAQDVILVGESMGGATVAAFFENSDQTDVVSKVVLDAPMLSLHEAVELGASSAVPGGYAVPAPLLWAAERLVSLRDGIDWAAVDYLDDTSWVKVPTLITHGTADETVPFTVSETLRAAQPDLVSLAEFPNALHTESWNLDPNRWEAVVGSFIKND